MTIVEAQFAGASATIAWCLAAVIAVFGSRTKALWGNVATGLIVGGATIASLVETLSKNSRIAERVHPSANTTVWTFSYTPQ